MRIHHVSHIPILIWVISANTNFSIAFQDSLSSFCASCNGEIESSSHYFLNVFSRYDSVLIRENTGPWKPAFAYVLCSALFPFITKRMTLLNFIRQINFIVLQHNDILSYKDFLWFHFFWYLNEHYKTNINIISLILGGRFDDSLFCNT